jgi:uncharacterized protein YbaR (Trm112 family)
LWTPPNNGLSEAQLVTQIAFRVDHSKVGLLEYFLTTTDYSTPVTEVIDMKRWLMDILACPVSDCRSELELEVFTSHNLKTEGEEVEEIDEALITCPKCGRWYPVIDGIACMLPDNLRMDGKQRIEETAFLERWKERIASDILESGVPFSLVSKD